MFRSSFWLAIILILTAEISSAHKVIFIVGSYRYYSLYTTLKRLDPEKQKLIGLYNEKTPQDKILTSRPDLVVADVMMKNIAKIAISLSKSGVRVFAVNSSDNDEQLKKAGVIFDSKLKNFYANPLEENYKNMFLYALSLSGVKVKYDDPIVLPKQGIYHPRSNQIFTSVKSYFKWYGRHKHTVGILFYQAYLDPLHREILNELIHSIEKEHIGVIAAYAYPAEKALKFIKDAKVDLVLSFSFKMSTSANPETQKLLREINVPIINIVNLFSETVPEWKASKTGLSPFEVSWQLNMPEISGLIEPTIVSGPVKAGSIRKYTPIDSEIRFLIKRVKKWIEVKGKANFRKRVAIVYYNHAPGKQNIGASYLNTPESIVEILKELKNEGYNVPDIPNKKSIMKLLIATGRNVGQWAPGELDEMLKHKEIIKIPIATYKRWYSKLPEGFREKVERQWGKPEECKVMCKDGYIIIPGLIIGNIFIGPQPARGVAGDAWKMYHSTKVYPHHQYIAFYLWLKHSFKADFIIHLGTHGTLEWLPGKQAGLSSEDPSYLLHSDMLDIYPYVVDDVGEGIQAKRRGLAVIIDHLTPPLVKSGLYKEYSKLLDLINRLKAETYNDQIKKDRIKRIRKLAAKLHLNGTIEEIEHKLIRMKEDLMPYGLHTFGVSPKGKPLKDFAKVIGTQDALRKLEESGPSEMGSLIKALSGGFVFPAIGNDPVRNPESIPTGKNFYAFDPTKVPSQEAWNTAVKLTDAMLKGYLKKHGRYPNKISIVLWATETIRNEGINEAKALYLIGMRPVWDKRGRVVDVVPIPASLLKRPRIDILIHASGLYRDMFPHMLKLLDKAVRIAATLKDTENFIEENAETIKKALIAKGMSPKQAEYLSLGRIFSEEPGSYGTGVALMTANTAFWDRPDQIAQVFINRTGYLFGSKVWGKKEKLLYKLNLSDVDIAIHSISSNLYRALDNDDVFQYLGGITLTVKALTGKFPEALIVRSTGKKDWVEDLQSTLSEEAATRYFNPKWIEGMKKEGYAGAREMEKFVEYLWGWQVTAPFAVKGYMWKKAYEVYVLDSYKMHLKEFFNRNNPWAYQSIVAWMLEAIRKGYWKAPQKVKIDLARRYARSVIEKGVACCEHTCNNPFLNSFVATILSTPSVASAKLAMSFKKAIEKATHKDINKAKRERESLIKKIAPGIRRIVKGVELREEKRQEEQSPSSGIQKILILIALSISLAFVLGYRSS